MNPDEFEYYFELDELEPFAGTPLTEIAETTIPQVGRADGRAAAPSRVARPQPDTSVSGATPGTSNASENPRRATPPAGHGHLPGSATAKETSATKASSEARSQTPRANDSEIPHEPEIPSEPGADVAHRRLSAASDAVMRQPNPGGAVTESGLERTPRGGISSWQDRMSVHVLGQFAFCNRAGIYSAENGDETDLDEPQPQWGYLPNFDLERIEEQLAKLIRQSSLLLVLVVVMILGMVGGVAIQDRRIFYPALVGALACSVYLINTGGGVIKLMWRRAAARRAERREPDPTIDRIEPVNWWSLLKAGFDPVAYQRQFRHPHLPLEGSPWRVLERGSLRIPAIKSGARKLGDAKHTIYPKHELRLAAYAVLLEATEHVQVPYGLVFPADSHLGLAVPITASMRERVAEQLERANDLLVRSQRGESDPRPPQDRNRCASCRLGQPVPLSDSEIRSIKKSRARLLVLTDKSDRTFHCACGDRFGSAPPHGQIIALGLTSKVE